MAKHTILKGSTSHSEYIVIKDSSSTTGARLTGLVFNSGSLVASYVRTRAARVAISLITQTVTGAFSSGGFVEVDSANCPGLYRVDIPDAAFATGVDKVVVVLKGATNMEQVELEYQLVDYNPQDATALGLSKLTSLTYTVAGMVDANIQAVSDDATVATKLEVVFDSEMSGLANSGTTISMVDSTLIGGGDNFWKGNVLGFTTGNNRGLLRRVTSSISASGTVGFPAFPFAVANGDAWYMEADTGVDILSVNGVTTVATFDTIKAQTVTIQADTDDLQTRLPAALVGGRMDSYLGSATANVLTAAVIAPDFGAEIAAAVWDELLAGHVTAGSAGPALVAAGSAGDPWTTVLPGAYGAGTAGNIIGNRLDAAVSTRATPAQVNTEVTNVLTVTTRAEPGQGSPPASASIALKVDYIYKATINEKHQTASFMTLYNYAGTVVDQKAPVSDDQITFISGKLGSGP